jgi:hypothetical protein
MLSGEFANREFGASGGEMLPMPAPPAKPGPPLIIEPPPWVTDPLAAADAPPPEAPTEQPLGALDAMKAADAEPDAADDRPAPGPTVVLPPLERPRIPEVDWRTEAVERALLAAPRCRRAGAAQVDAALPGERTAKTWRTS